MVSTQTSSSTLTAELNIYARMEIGKADEQRQVKTLRENGFVIEEVSDGVDMIEKIDRRIVNPDGTFFSLQIKGRDENPAMVSRYTDILIDYYEPYCGIGHKYTKNGRDQVSNYDRFTCRIQSNLYLINGAAQKKVIADVMVEWEDSPQRRKADSYLEKWADKLAWNHRRDEPDWYESDIFQRFSPLRSEQYEKVEVRCTQDRKNKRPKLLIFIPPTLYSESDAQCFEMTHG